MGTTRIAVVSAVVATGAAVVSSLLPAGPATATDCARAPTASSAWRAELPGRTPVYRRWRDISVRPAAPIGPDRAPALLVMRAGRDAAGRCWLRVRLPSRPNQATGWVAADRVVLRRTRWRLVVHLAERRLVVLRGGRAVARTSVVVGAERTPTPRGAFAVGYVTRGRAGDFFGSWTLALTAHSEALARFDGGDGRVALHGRGGTSLRDPLGTARSHGCVRIANADLEAAVRRIGVAGLPGVPVDIVR